MHNIKNHSLAVAIARTYPNTPENRLLNSRCYSNVIAYRQHGIRLTKCNNNKHIQLKPVLTLLRPLALSHSLWLLWSSHVLLVRGAAAAVLSCICICVFMCIYFQFIFYVAERIAYQWRNKRVKWIKRMNELHIFILHLLNAWTRTRHCVSASSVKYFVCLEKHSAILLLLPLLPLLVAVMVLLLQRRRWRWSWYSVVPLCASFHIELLCWCIMCLAIWSRERLSIVSRYQYNRLKRFVWMERMNERISQPNNQPPSQPAS